MLARSPSTNETPALDPGMTLVDVDSHRSCAIHELALSSNVDGEMLWIDAGGTATTAGFTDSRATHRMLRTLRVARAFTVHQHHQLVRRTVAMANERTSLIVAPNVTMLYETGDVPSAERDRLFEATTTLLADLGNAVDVPVLVSAPRADCDQWEKLTDRAGQEIAVESTNLGYAYDADGFDQFGYFQTGWWQTTIPYWVDLCGAGQPVGAAIDDTPGHGGPTLSSASRALGDLAGW